MTVEPPSRPLRFEGLVVVVTGGARGIGRAYANLLAARGASVALNDLGVDRAGGSPSPAPVEAAAEELRQAGGTVLADASDVADADGAQALVEAARSGFGRIDAVINNAGNFLGLRPFLETTLEEFAAVWRVHLGGTYNLCRAVLPQMLAEGRGRIVNSCSIQGLYGAATSADYACAKGAVQALTLSLAASVRGTGVAVNAISPGGFTRMVAQDDRDPAITAQLAKALRPELAAPVAAWLCHPDCSANGEILQAYAGRVSRTIIGEPEGAWDLELTPEGVAEAFPRLTADAPLWRASDSAQMAQRVVSEALRRRELDGA